MVDISSSITTSVFTIEGTIYNRNNSLSLTFVLKVEIYDSNGTILGASSAQEYVGQNGGSHEFKIAIPLDAPSVVARCIITVSR